MKHALIALIATLFATVSVGAFAADGPMPHHHHRHHHHHHHHRHMVTPRP
ncbi:MAG TPA: hypothetical protein VF472_02520 [Burkholderiaceae bacterium]